MLDLEKDLHHNHNIREIKGNLDRIRSPKPHLSYTMYIQINQYFSVDEMVQQITVLAIKF